MARKHQEQPKQSVEDQELVKRVDAMLSSETAPDQDVPDVTSLPVGRAAIKPEDHADTPFVISDQKSAPELPGDLLRKLKNVSRDQPKKAIKIDIADTDTDADSDAETEPSAETEPEPAPAVAPNKPNKVGWEPVGVAAPIIEGVNLNSSETDKAVDDIVANESDTLLALEDLKNVRRQKVVVKKPRGNIFNGIFKSKKILIIMAVLFLLLLGVPVTRYKLLGIVLKKDVTITVVDSKTGTPVSSAELTVSGNIVKTDDDGKAQVRSAVGSHSVNISKQYYQSMTLQYFVGITKSPTSHVKLVATGRLVPITVLNTITGAPVAGATITVLKTITKTNAKGQASLALPAGKKTEKASLSLHGYNKLTPLIEVTDTVAAANKFNLTPSGHVYFLSNNLDVVKTNLDGTERKVVLENSGREDSSSTTLVASRDWKFVALKARRDGARASLYLIDTSTDKVTEFDDSDSTFNVIGWYNHDLIYSLSGNSKPAWQNGQSLVKSYDADHQQLNQLDQSQAEGTSGDYAAQTFSNFYIADTSVVYTTQWTSHTTKLDTHDLTGKSNTIRGVQTNGKNKKDYQSFPAAATSQIKATLYQPRSIYFLVHSDESAKDSFYEYQDQTVKASSIDQAKFVQDYPSYALSPSGLRSLWNEPKAAKDSLSLGDSNGGAPKQIKTSEEYTTYGWYSDKYLLVSKNAGQLYIMSEAGLIANRQPLKITDYYKSSKVFVNYGYGGL